MDNSNNDCNFHLQTIDIVKVVLCHTPYRIHSKWIDAVLNSGYGLMALNKIGVVTGSKQVQVNGKEIVVNEATIS